MDYEITKLISLIQNHYYKNTLCHETKVLFDENYSCYMFNIL